MNQNQFVKIVSLLLWPCFFLLFSGTNLFSPHTSLFAQGTVYVSPNGNDSNSGSQSSPFRTIRKAFEEVDQSGTIDIAEGVYYEGELILRTGGTSSRHLTIKGAGPTKSIIKGSKVVNNWTSVGNNIWKISNWSTNSQQLFVNGEPYQQIGVQNGWHTNNYGGVPLLPPVGSGYGDLVTNSFYYNSNSDEMFIKVPSQMNPNDQLVELSTENFVFSGESSYVTIRELGFMHCNGTHTGARSKLVDLGPRNYTIENCRLTYGDFVNLNASGLNHTIRNNEILYAGDLGVDMNNGPFSYNQPAQNTLVENNRISYNNYRGFYAHWHTGGLKIIPAIRKVTIRNNLVEHNDGPGIWFDRPLGENIIEGNTCIGNLKGIFYEIGEPVTTVPFGAVICNNLVIGSRQQGIYVAASSDVTVQNNTVVNCWAGIVLHGMPRTFYSLKNNTVKNNIIHGGSVGDLILYKGDKTGNNQVDDNFYVTGVSAEGSTARSTIRVGVVTGNGYNINYRDLNSLANNEGLEQNGQHGDPIWEGMQTYQYLLGAGSPAEGSGINETQMCAENVVIGTFPVEFLSFDAMPDYANNQVVLKWETASETNNDYFVIEKSVDGLAYTGIEEINSLGDSRNVQRYFGQDQMPEPGRSFYRIKQVDIDGSFTHSNRVEVNFDPAAQFDFFPYPNPVSVGESLKVRIVSEIDQSVELGLYSIYGNKIDAFSAAVTAGTSSIEFNTSQLSKGLYYLLSSDQDFSKHAKMIEVR